METMYYLFNGLNFDVKLLVDQYNLVVDFDFFKEDDFYEIQIYYSIESDNEFLYCYWNTGRQKQITSTG